MPAKGGEVPEAAAAPPAPPEQAACPDFELWYELHRIQHRLNWKILFCVVCLLCVLLIQDKQIQTLTKAVKALQA